MPRQHLLAERAEDVVGMVVQEADAVIRLRGERDDDVDPEEQEGADDGGPPRRPARVLRLLVHRDGRVPAPVDEDREQQPVRERAERLDVERVEPAPRRMDGAGRMPEVDAAERHDREHREDDDLRCEQEPLRLGRDLDADVADGAHQDDPDDARDAHPEPARRGLVGAEEEERVRARDLREARHHEHVRVEDPPAAEPAGRGTERARPPDEGRAAVGVGLVQVLEGVRDQQHRHECERHHDRRLEADARDRRDEAERGREAVRGRGRGDPDDDAGEEAERVGLEALVAHVGRGQG